MSIFDTPQQYATDGKQRMSYVVWLINVMIIGCVFIAKRLYFKSQKENVPKKNIDTKTDIIEVMTDTLLFILLIVVMFGAPNEKLVGFLMTIFMIALAIIVVVFLRTSWSLSNIKNIKDIKNSLPKISYTAK
jgi:Ca2+/Na+ antiporter